MLNLNGNNHLIEFGCRNWWSDKKDYRSTELTANREESLPTQRYNHGPQATVAPASVFFAIELV
jgi:hypothetical protein